MSLTKTKFYKLYENNNIDEIYNYFQNFLTLEGGGSNEPLKIDLDFKQLSSLPQDEQYKKIKEKLEEAIEEQKKKLKKIKKGPLPYDPQDTINTLKKKIKSSRSTCSSSSSRP